MAKLKLSAESREESLACREQMETFAQPDKSRTSVTRDKDVVLIGLCKVLRWFCDAKGSPRGTGGKWACCWIKEEELQ
jgi:hypothetical protein